MSSFIDLTGQKFGKLTVLKRAEDLVTPKGRHKTQWLCKCECGDFCIVQPDKLKSGHTRSCGCLKGEKHKHSNSKLYPVWNSMRARCQNIKNSHYKYYGGRGIKVCSEWEKSFSVFYKWAIQSGYKEGLTIERIDVNGDYCPANCKWATLTEQGRNKRNNRLVTIKGDTHCVSEWAELFNTDYFTLYNRIARI